MLGVNYTSPGNLSQPPASSSRPHLEQTFVLLADDFLFFIFTAYNQQLISVVLGNSPEGCEMVLEEVGIMTCLINVLLIIMFIF